MAFTTFHNLAEEKQQRIITKGIEIFAKVSFTDAKTDLITKEAGISKGLLFHYFGSKKAYYLYLLNYSLNLLTRFEQITPPDSNENFFDILFASMDKKIQLISRYPNEMHFLNLASRETSKQVVQDVQLLIQRYLKTVHENSAAVLTHAITTLNLKKDIQKELLINGLTLYINAFINQKLRIYQNNPDDFFANAASIKAEMKAYLNLMLEGVEVKNDD